MAKTLQDMINEYAVKRAFDIGLLDEDIVKPVANTMIQGWKKSQEGLRNVVNQPAPHTISTLQNKNNELAARIKELEGKLAQKPTTAAI